MIFEQLAFIAVLITMFSSLITLSIDNRRLNSIVLIVQYIAVFWLVSIRWGIGLGGTVLVSGWAAIILIASMSNPATMREPVNFKKAETAFRALSGVMVWMFVFSIAPLLFKWFPARMVILWGGLILLGSGLLQLGMTTHPIRVVYGLLTILSGFEIMYSAIERSVLVVGMLAIITLALGATGVYLLNRMETEETG